jgi:hypothetical protein
MIESASDLEFCKGDPNLTPNNPLALSLSQMQDGVANVVKKWWLSRLSTSQAQTEVLSPTAVPITSSTEAGRSVVVNGIVLVKRGGCMFEEKAQLVKTLGGKGVIIQNSEVVFQHDFCAWSCSDHRLFYFLTGHCFHHGWKT